MRTLVVGGTVADGDGGPLIPKDVVIEGGRILAVLDPGSAPKCEVVIEADDQIVAPGFIDIHTHSDLSLLLDGRAESKIHQGVTTEVIGNCGFSAYPVLPRARQSHHDLIAGLGDDAVEMNWLDIDGYAHRIAEVGCAVNVVPLVGHGQLRVAAAGMARSLGRPQAAQMRALLEEMLDQGAFGMSTGLTYVPSGYADSVEITELAHVLAKHDRLYATHARTEGLLAIEEAAAVGLETGCRVQYSHLAINDPRRWGTAEQVTQYLESKRDAGCDIAFDLYPYDASSSSLTQYLPEWVQAGGSSAMTQRLRDTDTFDRAERILAMGWGDGIPWFWDRVLLARANGLCGVVDGSTVAEAAESAGLSAERLVLSLCRDGQNRIQVVLFYRDSRDVRTFLRHPLATIGSDGQALPFDLRGRRVHPRSYGAHARVLARYVRDERDLDLPEAIRKMTAAVADRVGLRDRGRLRRGYAADLVVFRPDAVEDTATFDRPASQPRGISHVLVNGRVAVRNGVQTNTREGRVLRA